MAAHLLPAGLVVLRSPSGCGKSTFANTLAAQIGDPGAIVSTDTIRYELTGDAEDHTREADVFGIRDTRVGARLRAGLSVIADSTNLTPGSITPLVRIAARFGAPISVVDCTIPMGLALSRDAQRDRNVGVDIIAEQYRTYGAHSVADLAAAATPGHPIEVFTSSSAVTGIAPHNFDATHITGGIDVIGDVHGQRGTLERLLAALGYRDDWTHPEARTPIFVGDLIDKGPDPVGVLDDVRAAHRRGLALCVRGNHEHKLARTLARIDAAGNTDEARNTEYTSASHGAKVTLTQLFADPRYNAGFGELTRWMNRLGTHLVCDGGDLVVAHAAAREADIGRTEFSSNKDRTRTEGYFLYGPSTGRRGGDGFPERIDWVADYTGDATIVRGHVTVEVPELRNRVASVDTGAGDGASLTALRWPEMRFTSVDIATGDVTETAATQATTAVVATTAA